MINMFYVSLFLTLATKVLANCEINCAAVQCLKPNCTTGQKIISSPCECCSQCADIEDCGCSLNICSRVRCNNQLNCPFGEVGGHCNCCNMCKPDCRTQLCPPLINCISGARNVKHGCCNACVKIASPSEKCDCLREIAIGLILPETARVCPFDKYCVEGKCVVG